MRCPRVRPVPTRSGPPRRGSRARSRRSMVRAYRRPAEGAIGRGRATDDHAPMQSAGRLSSPSSGMRRSPGRSAVASRVLAGLGWLAIATAGAWLVFATPLLDRVIRLDTTAAANPIVGAVALAVALVAPAAFAALGIARLAGAAAHARRLAAARPPVSRIADRLPAGCHVLPSVRLPDGSRIPDVVVGPHGVVTFRRVPPLEAVRRTGERWEVRFSDGRWRQVESPQWRAARDAERLRRHLEAAERDFTVRVQAAVLGDPALVARAEGCAVVRLDDVPAWVAALPAQRALTPERIAHVHQVLAEPA